VKHVVDEVVLFVEKQSLSELDEILSILLNKKEKKKEIETSSEEEEEKKEERFTLDVILSLLLDELKEKLILDSDILSQCDIKERKKYYNFMKEFYETHELERNKMISVLLILICGISNALELDEISFCFPLIARVLKKESDVICQKFMLLCVIYLFTLSLNVGIKILKSVLEDDPIGTLGNLVLEDEFFVGYIASLMMMEFIVYLKNQKMEIPEIDISKFVVKFKESVDFISISVNIVLFSIYLLSVLVFLDNSLIRNFEFRKIVGDFIENISKNDLFSSFFIAVFSHLEFVVKFISKCEFFEGDELISKMIFFFIVFQRSYMIYLEKNPDILKNIDERFYFFCEFIRNTQKMISQCLYKGGSFYGGDDNNDLSLLKIEVLKFCRMLFRGGHVFHLLWCCIYGLEYYSIENFELIPQYFPFFLYLFILSSTTLLKADNFLYDSRFVPKIVNHICFDLFIPSSKLLSNKIFFHLFLKLLLDRKNTLMIISDVEMEYLIWVFANSDAIVIFSKEQWKYEIEQGCMDIILSSISEVIRKSVVVSRRGMFSELAVSVLVSIVLTANEEKDDYSCGSGNTIFEQLTEKLSETSFIERLYSLKETRKEKDDYLRSLLSVVIVGLHGLGSASLLEEEISEEMSEILLLIKYFVNKKSSSSL
jgi:hypothetical protein